MSFGHHARGFHSHCRSNYGSGLGNCICFCFCCLPIMILCSGGIGAYMMVDSFTDHRSGKIDEFDSAARQWTAGHRSAFANMPTVYVQGDSDFKEVALTSKSSDSTPADKDSGCKEDSSKINQYTPLKWQRSDITLYDACDDCSWHDGCETGNVASFDVYIGSSQSYINLPLFQASSRYVGTSHSDESQCEDGNFFDTYTGYCYAYSVLDKICVKVSEQNGKWEIDSSNGGSGCGDSSGWQPGSYRPFKIYGSADFPSNLQVSVTVRSLQDPLVQFYKSAGTAASSFGLCQSAKFWVGLACLSVFGLFCIVLPVLLARYICGCCGGSNYNSGPSVDHCSVPPSYEEHLVQPSAFRHDNADQA